MTSVECFVQTLRARGISWMATLCGHGLDPLFHAASRAGIRLIGTRNEQTASYMAECWGRLTRRPGVCAVSSGVAHVNAMSGLADAALDGAPFLLISGAGALSTRGLGHFQDLDQVALARPICRYARLIDCPERANEILETALDRAAGPPPGPVHLTFPMDVQKAEVDPARLIAPRRPPALIPAGDPEGAAEALARCARPLIVAGSGVYYAEAGEAMLAFAEEFEIPVVVPIWDRGPVARASRVFLGVLGAASGGPRLLPDADCVLLAGAAADYRTGFLQPGAMAPGAVVVEMTRGWDRLPAALRQRGGNPYGDWLAEASRRRDAFRAAVAETAARQAAGGVHAADIAAALGEVLTGDAVLIIDGGSIGQWAHQLLCDRYPGHWLTCGRSGVVGYGIAGAMAARLAYPERPVILLSGDGAFTFNVADLESAVRQRLHFTAIVADDQGWGITRTGHLRQFGAPVASSLGPVDFPKLAASLGAHGAAAGSRQEIAAELRAALGRDAASVIHVPIAGGNP